MKKFSRFLILVLFVCVSDCKTIYHDKQNPCTKGEYGNTAACDEWKKNFPKEYERYINRLNRKKH